MSEDGSLQPQTVLTCASDQVGAREDCWPIENVSKVSVITGEFNGHSVSGLIHYCWAYFAITMGFDLLQAFVLENIQVLE